MKRTEKKDLNSMLKDISTISSHIPIVESNLENKIETTFIGIKKLIIESINDADAVIGCCNYLTEWEIIDAIANCSYGSSIVIDKFSFYNSSYIKSDSYIKKYSQFKKINLPIKFPTDANVSDTVKMYRDVLEKSNIGAIRSLGDKENNCGILHLKHFILLRKVNNYLVPYAIINGTYNFSRSGQYNIEICERNNSVLRFDSFFEITLKTLYSSENLINFENVEQSTYQKTIDISSNSTPLSNNNQIFKNIDLFDLSLDFQHDYLTFSNLDNVIKNILSNSKYFYAKIQIKPVKSEKFKIPWIRPNFSKSKIKTITSYSIHFRILINDKSDDYLSLGKFYNFQIAELAMKYCFEIFTLRSFSDYEFNEIFHIYHDIFYHDILFKYDNNKKDLEKQLEIKKFVALNNCLEILKNK